MATIKDVAQAAQVSTAAVSRVLNKDDNISVSPEVRARIFQAAHVLGYVSPRQRKAAEHKTHLVIGVADWRIIRPDRHNVRLSSLSCLVQMMTDQYEVTFVRLTFGEPQKVDGIIALGVFSEKEIDFLRSLSFAIVFVNSNQHNYEFDQVQVDFERGQEQMVSYLLDQKRYTGLGYIGGIYDGANGRIGTHRLAAIRRILEKRGQYDPRTFHVGEISRESGYALAKKRFVGRKVLFTLIVCAMALPKQVILIPLLREMSSLNLYNTIWAVIFPIVGWPFGVFLMKQFSEGIPTEMLEAARIDGASEAKTFVSIVLPMVKPGVGALAIFTFINSWNDYFMQLIMLSSTSNLTISLGIAKLQAENSTDFGLIMAGAALAAVPIIIIFLIFQKYFTKGIAMGAVKG